MPADRYGFGDGPEGVEEDQQQAKRTVSRLASRTLKLGDLSINADYSCNTSNYSKGRTMTVKKIVVHYTGGTGTALANVKYYQNTLPSGSRASAHFFVGHKSENAQIYQSVTQRDTAWHADRRELQQIASKSLPQ
jgi:N-acetyl-anhydromuramyl-L-alanine amidase AmpD